MDLLNQLTLNVSPGPHFEEESASALVSKPLVRLIAFYLPQFHAIPENDEWWGAGFTEWTNVTKSFPRFAGHYQPRLPGALGFYDPTNPEVLRHQAELARKYGVGGFCFHHYWFNGRTVLDRPIRTLLANRDIQLPFCINWANESWSRRWDGNDKNILLKQEHSAEDDIAFAHSLEPLFADSRYIRIEGRPLLIIYRPSLFPDPAATVDRWRNHFSRKGFGNPYIATVQARDNGDPARFGMDAAVGFPPFWAGSSLPLLRDLPLFDSKFRGEVRDYDAMARATIATYPENDRTFPGVCPSWDNEARKPGRGTSFTGSTPSAYGKWLKSACDASIRSFPEHERFVFVNAWNEWAEGAYLEPDRHFGFAYLAETARVLNSLSSDVSSGDVGWQRATLDAPPPHISVVKRARRTARRVLNNLAVLLEDIAWKLRGH